jgi:hypothetical protein
MMDLTGAFLQSLVWVLGPLIMAAACLALAHSGWREPRKLAFLLPAASYLLTMILPMHYMYLRYVMPVTFILAVFSGRGMVLGLELAGRSRLAMSLGVMVALAWPLGLSLDLALQMHNDSRYEAERWLSANMVENRSIGYFGSVKALPRLRADARPISLPEGASSAFDYLQENGPDFVIILPDWTSAPGMQHSSHCPDDIYEKLNDGSLGYTLDAMFETNYFIKQRLLDYPSVNPPVRIFMKAGIPPPVALEAYRNSLTHENSRRIQ